MPTDKNDKEAGVDGVEHDPQPVQDEQSLDALVAAIEHQLIAADERHDNVLADMQSRLGALSGDVDDIRQRIPEDLTGKLQGIETGLETLTERVSLMSAHTDASTETDGMLGSDDSVVEHDEIEDVAQLDDEISFDAADATSDVAIESEVEPAGEATGPAALRSAAPSSDDDEDGDANPPQHLTNSIDTFDMVETTLPGDPGSPWDQESAEALTKLFDSEQQNEVQAEAPIMPAKTPDPEYDAGETAQRSAHDVQVGSVDRDWLESKFTEIAERIEQTLAELDPTQVTAELGERLNSFEQRVDSSLQDVATRADLGGLKELEDHVSGMAAQMAQTESHLHRLDSIEGTLHDVVARFNEVGGAAAFGDMSASQGGIDPEQIADVAASRIADQLAAAGHSSDGNALADVRLMIENFLNEHRQGNEQTAQTLDTIQEAMLRILDRLDVLEASAYAGETQPGVAVAGDYSAPTAEQELPATDDDLARAAEGWAEPAEAARQDGSEPVADQQWADSDPGTNDAMHDLESEATVIIQGREDTPPAQQSPAAAQGDPAQSLAGSTLPEAQPTAPVAPNPNQASPDLLSDRTDSVVMPAEASATSRDAIDKIRHNFIADAQQAKAMAAQAAVTVAQQPEKKNPRKSLLAGLKKGGAKAEGEGGFFATKSRRLLVGALLAVIVIQGAMVLMPGEDASKPSPAASQTSQQTGEVDRKSAVGKSEKSSALVPGDGFSPAVTDDVVLNDLKSAMHDAQHRASGSVDLPFGLLLQQTTAKDWTKVGRPIVGPGAANAKVTEVAFQHDQRAAGGKVIRAPQTSESATRSKMPPITVGPSSLRMAAANGDPSAQFEVATRMSEGKGTKQDFKQAATWFKRSAGQGFAPAQYRLGTLYERGLGVSRDVNRAQIWYLKAAEQGNLRAMHNLAVLSAGQASGKPDYDRAAQWFIKAAESGLADSQFNAGVLFENGLGVSKDLSEAYKWYTLAARNGDKESLKRSQKLRSELKIEALGEAERAVRSFVPSPVDALVNNARLAGQEWKSRVRG